jgi:periplasmic copper chaperone A
VRPAFTKRKRRRVWHLHANVTFDIYTMINTTKLIAASAAFIWTTGVFAHITLEQPTVEAGSYYKATLRVGHGCDGMSTNALRVQIPAGFQGAKPMPKHGWAVEIRSQALATPYDSHGKTVTHDVADITWTATNAEAYLPDNQYDEFVLRGKAPVQAGPLWFKVIQLCKAGDKQGQNAWVEVPESGVTKQDLKFPAALLEVTDRSASGPNTTSATTPVTAAPTTPATKHQH